MESTKKEEQIQKDKDLKLKTDIDQERIESIILTFFEKEGFNTKLSKEYKGEANFYSNLHYKAFTRFFPELPEKFTNMESYYPRIIYWIINNILMLKDHSNIDHGFKLKLVELLKDLQHEDGGFRGAPKGEAHIISTYAVVMVIIDLGIPEAYDIIDIPKMRNYLLKMKNNKESTLVDKNDNFLLDKEKTDGKKL